ncbi:GDP-mannose pyrophosphatase NudK [Chitinivorax sp. PXF-14]|uniref:GDP-mannose pyrophosphatase NudK n=1 Tax=Chitinivorax sp. PXF-14 TaxID=3230488 RepID=UPI00346690CF
MPHNPAKPDVEIRDVQLLSDNWYFLRKYTIDYRRSDGSWQRQMREVYDRGNGATILLYNRERQSVVLIRQFRLPTYLNDYHGMLIETCAGLLDADDPETCIRRETEEETGYRVRHVRKVFESFMSPGAVTERIHFFVGEYEPTDKVESGGGIEHEGEDIEVLELKLDEALAMIERGEIVDGKTIMLLQYAKLHGLLG